MTDSGAAPDGPAFATSSVRDHYDRLDRLYRRLWGEHVHHGLWTDPSFTPEEAVRHLVRWVAEEAGITAEDRVCDVGCGYGAPARLWARECGADVMGFTVSAAQHTYAEAQSVEGPSPTYRLRGFLENDLPGAAFDVVAAIESLTHIRDQPGVLREAARLLRPGGRLVACVWMADPAPTGWQRRHLLGPIVEEGCLSGLPTATDLHHWATAAGLTVERVNDLTPLVRRTWSVVIRRFLGALVTDPAVLRTLLAASGSERVFARTIPRIWLAQHLGALRYGWFLATRD